MDTNRHEEDGAVQTFIESIRQVSNRLQGKYVGKSVLAVAIPKETSERESVSMQMPCGILEVSLSDEGDSTPRPPANQVAPRLGPSCIYVPEHSTRYAQHSPAIACGELGFTIGELKFRQDP